MPPINKKDIADQPLAIPMKQGIHLERRGGIVYTNVPHAAVVHSPTGYEFGYEGSGPADLALNILDELLRLQGFKGARTAGLAGTYYQKSYELHQDFKRAYIARVDQDHGGIISYLSVTDWLAHRLTPALGKGKPPRDYKEAEEAWLLEDDEYQTTLADPLRDKLQAKRLGE